MRWLRPARGEGLDLARKPAFEAGAAFRLDRELVDLRFEAADLLLDFCGVFLLVLEGLRTAMRLQSGDTGRKFQDWQNLTFNHVYVSRSDYSIVSYPASLRGICVDRRSEKSPATMGYALRSG